MRTVSAADANRFFSKLLREVQAGETVVVTSRGKPVATLSPVGDNLAEEERRGKAWQGYIAHLASRPVLNIPITWTRDDIYEDHF